jgi:hypothetical protein
MDGLLTCSNVTRSEFALRYQCLIIWLLIRIRYNFLYAGYFLLS